MNCFMLFVYLLLLALTACQSGPNTSTALAVDSVVVRKATEQVPEGVSIRYVKISGGNDTAVNRINASIELAIKHFLTADVEANQFRQNSLRLQSMADVVAGFFKEAMADSGKTSRYYNSTQVDTTFMSDKILSVRYVHQSNYGSGIDRQLELFQNFDLKTGAELQLTDVVLDTMAFKKLAEQEFIRAVTKTTEDQAYYKKTGGLQGFFREQGRFELPLDNEFAITRIGIVLRYNYYWGFDQEVHIPWVKLITKPYLNRTRLAL